MNEIFNNSIKFILQDEFWEDIDENIWCDEKDLEDIVNSKEEIQCIIKILHWIHNYIEDLNDLKIYDEIRKKLKIDPEIVYNEVFKNKL